MMLELTEVETHYGESAARVEIVFFSKDEVEARYNLERILKKILEDEDVIQVYGDIIRNED